MVAIDSRDCYYALYGCEEMDGAAMHTHTCACVCDDNTDDVYRWTHARLLEHAQRSVQTDDAVGDTCWQQ